MSNETRELLFFILVGASVLNFMIALVSRMQTKDKAYNALIIYWPSVIFSFLMAGILSGSIKEISYSYILQIFSSNLMVHILNKAIGLEANWKKYFSLQALGITISVIMIEMGTFSFTTALLPVCISYSYPFISTLHYLLWTIRKRSNWVEKTLGFITVTTVIHHFNFIFFRLVPNSEHIGFSFTLAQYQCLAVLLPLIISQRKERLEKQNLQNVILTLSGEAKQTDNVDLLYLKVEELAAEIEKSNRKLKEEREINEILIKTISHDLATPLTVIHNYSEMLKKNTFPKEKTETILDRILASSDKSLNMISRIRNAILTRSQAQLITPTAVRFNQVIHQSLELFETKLQSKNIQVINHNQISDEVLILADKDAVIEHILSNIISNALKFSHPNSAIEISTREEDESVYLVVRDFGVGYKNQNTKFITVSEGTQGETGTGFGLLILNYFLNQFSGEMTIVPAAPGTLVTLKFLKYLDASERSFQASKQIESLS